MRGMNLVLVAALLAACGSVTDTAGSSGDKNGRGYALTLASTGTGTGTLNAAPAAEYYDSGSVVVVTATAAAGSIFTGWFQGCTTRSNPCSVVMDSRKFVTATFHTFAFTPTGTGAGSASVTTTSFTQDGALIAITALPAAGSVFTGWRGDLCRQPVNPCTITLTKATTVSGTFAPESGVRRFDGEYTGTIDRPANVGGTDIVNFVINNGSVTGKWVSGRVINGSISETGAFAGHSPETTAGDCTYDFTGTFSISAKDGITLSTASGGWIQNRTATCIGFNTPAASGGWTVTRDLIQNNDKL